VDAPAETGSAVPDRAVTDAGVRFHCRQCGAELAYTPGTTALECGYCGFENEIESGPEPVAELDYRAFLAELRDAAPSVEVATVKCEACGALVDRPENLDAYACVFCGKSIVATDASTRLLKPGGVLPFGIRHEDAYRAYRRWVESRWFAPSKLRRFARSGRRLDGVYLAFWTYDAEAITDYRGERGEDYWETKHVTEMRDGKRVRRSKRVRRTRWYPAAGRVEDSFNDLLVPASRSLPDRSLRALEPWDVVNLVPFTPEFLAGFQAERYQVELDEGFEAARGIMDGVIRQTVRHDIGGDRQHIHELRTAFPHITFKHVLLPVWISAYEFGGRTFRILVNARTGEVHGERPYSFWKILLAVLGGLLIVLVIALIIGIFSG
jgi:DNA-directed RNA polymerase subunit RPC12/RpoP